MPLALIAGAGIGGLAAGIALRRAGWDVRVFERAEKPRDVGFGVALAPNAVAALRHLGLSDAINAHGVVPAAGEVRRPDGRAIRSGRADALPTGDLLRIILRSELHGVLLDHLPAGSLEVNRGVVRFHADAARVRVELGDGTSASGDILIGADGIGSTIRAQLHPSEPPPMPSGFFALRGLSPAVDRLNGFQGFWYFGRGVESGIAQASPTQIYWFLSLFSADVHRGPSDVHAVFQRETAKFDPQYRAIVNATLPGDMRLDELFVREPLDRWGDGPVTLLGDAAHPMLPYTGQGAAQALEDAVGLGRALAHGGDAIAALRRYEHVRSRRANAIVRSGPRIARLTTTRNPVIGFLRNTAIRLMPARVLVRAFADAGPDPNQALS